MMQTVTVAPRVVRAPWEPAPSGRRTYVDATHVPKVLGGMGTTIMSTSQGVMTGHDARKAGVGGEVVAHVW